MEIAAVVEIDRFRVPLDRAYHPDDHTWVRLEGDLARIGMDELGQETAGDMAALFLLPAGTELRRGDEMGSCEAQKYVGALRAPVCGTVVEINERVLANPRLVNTDPYGEGWLILIRPAAHLADELDDLISGNAVGPWFAEKLEQFRREGSVAE